MEYDIPAGEKSQLQATVYQLAEHFPLRCVEKDRHFVLLDYTETVFSAGLVSEVLTLDQNQSMAGDNELHDHSQRKEGIVFFKKPWPMSSQQKYPELLTTMMEFIKLHGFAAHARCRTATSTSYSVRLEDIRQHLTHNVEGLTTISKSKVYNLLKPDRSNTAEAARQKDAFDVRVEVKACDISKENKCA